jgi:hypothetical protein
MIAAKLRRSREVPELDPIKIENAFHVRDLDAQVGGRAVVHEREEYAHQLLI